MFSVNPVLSLPHVRLPILRLLRRCAPRNDEMQWIFCPGQALLSSPWRTIEIATSPSAPRNDSEGMALGTGDSLRDFAMDITSFLGYS
jgi:hypothetical protein